MGDNPEELHLVSFGAHVPAKRHLLLLEFIFQGAYHLWEFWGSCVDAVICRGPSIEEAYDHFWRAPLDWIIYIWRLHQDFHNCSQALTHSPIPAASSLVYRNPLLLRTMFHVIHTLVWLCLESWLILWPVPEQWNVAEVTHQSLGHRNPSSFYLVLIEPSCHPPRKLWKHPCGEVVKTLSYSPW